MLRLLQDAVDKYTVVINEGKKTERITITVDEDFKTKLEKVARIRGGKELSVLCQEYVVNGFIEDCKNLLLAEMNKTKLDEFLANNS